MPDQPETRRIVAQVLDDFRRVWKEMAWTVVVYRVLCAIVLIPLGGLLFRGLLALSGRTMLADHDILIFLLRPLGWIILIVMGAVWITISVLEFVALMAVAHDAQGKARVRARTALRIAARKAWPVLRVTARVVAVGILIAIPFLAAAGGLFLLLLTEYDINYYLTDKPPVFWAAVASIGAVLAVMALVLIRVLAAYVFFLPLLLLEEVPPSRALRMSRERTAGHRRLIFRWFVAWAVATWVLLSIGSGLVALLGRLLLPEVGNSLTLLAVATGSMLLIWALVTFATTVVTVSVGVLALLHLYRRVGMPEGTRTVPIAPDADPGTREGARLPRGRLVAGLIIALCAACAVGAVALSSFHLEDKTTITAHRGASRAAPENTLASVRRAIADRADWVEIDVQQTADDVVIVCHDRDLKKLAGSDLVVFQSRAEELRGVDVGSFFSPEFKGERLPTLDEVLEECRGKAGVNIELKEYGPTRDLERLVVERVEALGMQDQVVVMSLDHGSVARMRKLRPEWKVGLLAAVALGNLTGADAGFIAVSPRLATSGFIRRTQRAGKEVYVWTVNDPVAMSRYFSLGIDSLITDDPALARRVLEQRREMSPFERLLIELAAFLGASREVEMTAEDA